MSRFDALALLGLLASPAAAFWRTPCKSPIVVERMDPIVSPGKVSGHTHTIMGGNGFAPTMNYNSTQASTCSSCTVIGDNSNYWVPALYYQAEDGTFESVDQVGGATVYYLQRAGNGETLKAFPEGFRMISGDPFKRSGGDDFASQAISYNCLGTSNPETGNFPNTNCPDGLRAQVFFPSCWNGKDLDTADHKSHMSFPTGSYNNGPCPADFPVHLVSIFFEIIWDTNKFANQWHGNSQPFVFAMGDPTGYGGHGDFIMGWEVDHLQRAVDTCTNLSGRVEDCPEFQLIPDSQAEGCSVAPVVNEPVTGTLSQLPGCNPVQQGPNEAQIITTNCGASTTLSQSNQTSFKDLTSEGWGYTGCGTDNYYSRILTGASTSQASMTNDQCVQFCSSKGFSVAGTEYSDECYCGNSIPDSGAPIPGLPGNCKMACAGDSAQMCGGGGTISLYTKCSGSTCTNANVGGPASQVISTPSTSNSSSAASSSSSSSSAASVAAASISFTGSSSSPGSTGSSGSSGSGSSGSGSTGTSSSDIGLPGSGSGSPSSGSSGSSGSSWPASSTVASSTQPSTSSTGSSGSAPSASASGTWSTPSSASSSAASFVPTTTATPPGNASVPVGWAYSGCFVDVVFPRSLSTWSTFNGPKMTNSACATFCDSKGHMLSGTEYAGQCFCGDELVGSEQSDETDCNMPCSGNAGETCGGPGRLSVYKKSSGSSRRAKRHLAAHDRRAGRSHHA